MKKRETKLERLTNMIEWDNWENESDESYMEISEVLYSRLEWIKEQIEDSDIDKDGKEEAYETIEMLEILLEGMKDKEIK